MDKDPISSCIGDCGRWQFGIGILMGFLKFSLAWSQFGIVFLAPPTDFRCEDRLVSDASDTVAEGGKCFLKNDSSTECTSFAYNGSAFDSSIITEWNLVCSRAFLVHATQITFMAGFLIGSVLFGVTSDKRGRRLPLLVAVVLQIVAAFCIAFAPTFGAFLAARFVSSLASGGLAVISFVLCMESFGGKWKTIVPILYHAPLGVGNALMAGLAYLLRDWRQLQLWLAALSVLYLSYVRLVPESPRWLLATGRTDEATEVLQRAAVVNGKDPKRVAAIIASTRIDETKAPTFRTLFRTKGFKLKTLILCVEWFGAGVGVFAFIQNVGNIGGNIFVTSTIVGLNVIPGMPLCIFLANRVANKKKIIIASQLFAAVCFVAIVFIPKGVHLHDWPRVLFSGLGIIGIDVFVAMLYVYTASMYPTVVRNGAMGAVTVASRIGSMLAPLVLSLDRISEALPLTSLALLMIILSVALLPMPEVEEDPDAAYARLEGEKAVQVLLVPK